MWKRWAIRIALAYSERLFDKWLLKQNGETQTIVDELLKNFADYLRLKRSKTANLIADTLADWRD